MGWDFVFASWDGMNSLHLDKIVWMVLSEHSK